MNNVFRQYVGFKCEETTWSYGSAKWAYAHSAPENGQIGTIVGPDVHRWALWNLHGFSTNCA
eukprot:7492057-Ditylum_brightwellii.AAC.1